MTDAPPPSPPIGGSAPPPPSQVPPPPPPPPNLLAPPGAVGYTASPMGSVPLERVGKLATAVSALTLVSGVVSLVSIWASQAAQDDARALLDGEITDTEFVEGAAPYLLTSLVQVVATIAAAVVVMIWMFRLAKNLRTLHRGTTWGPGWAIGGWFLPPFLFIIPFLMFRELWKASDPAVPVGGSWKVGRVSPLVPLWLVVYSLIPVGLLIAQSSSGFSFGASERDAAQQVIDDQALTIVSGVVAIVGAAVFILLVRRLTARHQQLTGEVAAGR